MAESSYTAVGLGSQTPDIFGKLSQILTIKGQQQGLKGQAAEVAMTQQSQRQREALSKYDFSKHLGQDGLPDLNSLAMDPELRAAAGDQYQEVISKAATVREQQLQNQKSLVGLRTEQRQAFADLMGGLRGDADVGADNEKGRQKINEAMIQYGELYGEDALPVLSAYATQLKNVPQGKLGTALKAIQMQALSAGQQVGAQSPQYTSTGARLTNVNPNAPMGTAPDIATELPPGVQILTDQKGAQFAFNPQTNQVTPIGAGRGGPPTGPSAAPGQPTFSQPTYAGQARDIEAQQQEVGNIRTTADQAPMNRNIFQHILKLNEDTSSGQLVSSLQRVPVIGQIFGDNYQEMGKYLEKNAIANMQAMGGPPSDARLSAAVAANGSTAFNPKALKAVTQFNYATNTGLEHFRKGVDKAIGTKDPDYGKLPEFKAAWAQNFDIDVFRLENAIADGDKKAQAEILETLSPAQAAALIEKRKNLQALTKEGRLSQ
jgi:hypothetical protein